MRAFLTALCCLVATAAIAHPAPNSSLRLTVLADQVRAEYWLPVSELELARAQDPAADLPTYLLRRMSAQGPDGAAWRIAVTGIRQANYLDHEYLVAALLLTPAVGQPTRRLMLADDVITHEVRNHRLWVVQNLPAGNRVVGTLQYPVRRLEIALSE